MRVKMLDGSHYDIDDFDIICEAKDDGGRHFSGNAEVHVDLRDDLEVHPDFRCLWVGYATYDGDWGADFTHTKWEPRLPIQYSGRLTVGATLGILDDEPLRFIIDATEKQSVLQDVLNKAIIDIPELREVCNSVYKDTLDSSLRAKLIRKGVDLSFTSGSSHRFDVIDFVKLNMELIKAYINKPFKYEVHIDDSVQLSLISSGLGTISL